MALKPLNDRIIVTPAEAETRTASGLVLPDSAQEKPQRGKVIAVGPGKRLDNGTLVRPDVNVGDSVLYGKYSGTEVRLAGEDYVILRAEDVLGIVVGGAAPKTTKPAKAIPAKKPKVTKPAKAAVSRPKSAPKKTAGKPAGKKTAKPAAKRKK